MHAQNQGIIEGIKSSALIRGLVIAAGVVKEEDLKKARERFKEENLDAKNNGGVMIIDGKFDYKDMKSTPYIIDADTRKQTRESTFDYFGVNEEFVQNKFTAEKYESVYEGKLEPFAIMLTDALTAFLFTDRELGFGNEIYANMNKVKYQSISSVVSIVNSTKELGLFTRDEYREMLGYEPLGPDRGGDEIMIAVNNYQSDTQIQEGEENNEE
jgi:HK97 family phage portal protein